MKVTEKNIRYKNTAKVKDESFSIDDLQHYNLYLNIGDESFEFCVVKTETNKCLMLEEFSFNSSDDSSKVLQKIWDEHHFLKAAFWKKIKVSFKNQTFNFIPNSLYSKEHNEDYVNFTSDFNSDKDAIGVYKHISFSGINVFTYSKSVLEFLNKIYPKHKIEVVHQSSSLIEATFRGKFEHEKRVLLNVEKSNISITVVNKNELIYHNRFMITSSEDFIYYIMLVYKELNLDVEKDTLMIFGEITPNSPLYDAIHKYIRFSNFGKRPKFLNFSYHFDEVFDHKFLSTYAIHLCE